MSENAREPWGAFAKEAQSIISENRKLARKSVASANQKSGKQYGDRTIKEFWALFSAKSGITRALWALKRADDLEARLKKLEVSLAEKSAFPYEGVWREGTHSKGCFVTHNGGMWHCNQDTQTKPGTGPHWTLAVKAGVKAK